jgi:cell division protein FtsL
MSVVAQGAAPRRARARSSSRPWLGGGVLWILLFAVLLAGVVAVNVTVLRLNVELDQVGQERSELRVDISRLRSELSSASATARIERLAQKELGFVRHDTDATIYVRLRR